MSEKLDCLALHEAGHAVSFCYLNFPWLNRGYPEGV